MKTLQETFDFVCSNVIKQGRPSLRNGHCAYRGADGTKCAAGFCIPDEKYDPEMDAAASSDAYHLEKNFGPDVFDGHDLGLICRLQDLHDTAAMVPNEFLSFFKKNADYLALELGLSPEVLV